MARSDLLDLYESGGLKWKRPMEFGDLTPEQMETVKAEARSAIHAFEDEIETWDEARVVILGNSKGMPQVYIMPLKNTSPPEFDNHVH